MGSSVHQAAPLAKPVAQVANIPSANSRAVSVVLEDLNVTLASSLSAIGAVCVYH